MDKHGPNSPEDYQKLWSRRKGKPFLRVFFLVVLWARFLVFNSYPNRRAAAQNTRSSGDLGAGLTSQPLGGCAALSAHLAVRLALDAPRARLAASTALTALGRGAAQRAASLGRLALAPPV